MEKPYNRIVLIGNGFDKALGLKTSYFNFIFDYLRRIGIEAINKHNLDTGLITLNKQRIPFESSPEEYIVEIKSINTIKGLLEYFEGKFRIAYNHLFFKDLITGFIEPRWVDIEQYYYYTLKRRFRSYQATQEKNKNLDSIISLNKCLDKLAIALDDYIAEQQDNISINFLDSHMSSLIEKIKEPLRTERSKLIKNHNRQLSPKTVVFLNFNYTTTLRNLLNSSFINENIKHISIHGTVRDETNPIIFGYGDDTGEEYKELEIEGENELLRKIKSFQYRNAHYHNLLNYLEESEFDVYVIGHSCGLSDRTLLKTIFEHKHCLAIQNFHYKGESEDFEKRIEMSRHFSNKVLMRERILPFDELAIIPQAEYTPT